MSTNYKESRVIERCECFICNGWFEVRETSTGHYEVIHI